MQRVSNIRISAQSAAILTALLVTAGCSPFSGERGAVLLLFPYFWWPLKLYLYKRLIDSAARPLRAGRAYLLSILRIGMGIALSGAALLWIGMPGALFLYPFIALASWATVFSCIDSSRRRMSLARFLMLGLMLSLLLNVAVVLVTGSIGVGC